MPAELCYLYGSFMEDYLHDIAICQEFALRNREKMAEILLQKTGLTALESFQTIHNYIDVEERILRKGAVSAKAGEKLLIPINMRDGSLICVGKGNEEWNCSAPHGAGRLMSRNAARQSISVEDNNRLSFHMTDGTVIKRTWHDRSRSESWTEEKRAEFSQKRRKA